MKPLRSDGIRGTLMSVVWHEDENIVKNKAAGESLDHLHAGEKHTRELCRDELVVTIGG